MKRRWATLIGTLLEWPPGEAPGQAHHRGRKLNANLPSGQRNGLDMALRR